MSDKPNKPRPETYDHDEDVFGVPPEPGHVWPPSTDASDVGNSLPAGGGGATGDSAEFAWLEDTRDLDETFEEVRELNRKLAEHTASSDSEDSNFGSTKWKPSTTADVTSKAPVAKSETKAEAKASPGSTGKTFAADTDNVDHVSPASKATRYRIRTDAENEMSQLWTNVFFSGDRTPPKAVVVASVRQGDGASQISGALALLGAESNPELSIALVDVNLRRPKLADMLGLKNAPGLSEVVSGKVSLKDAIQTIPLAHGAKLHVLTAGSTPKHTMSMLKSRQLKSVVGQVRSHFDHTIIDVAAANQHADAQILGSHVDGVLLVASAGTTPREAVAEAKKRVQISGAKCLGLVINQRTDPIPALLYDIT